MLRLGVSAFILFAVLTPDVRAEPVKAAVVRSQGTQFLGLTIWDELNTNWADFGSVPVQIDYTSLAGFNLTLEQINATDADVLIISTAGANGYQESEIQAIADYIAAGHGVIITSDSFRLAPFAPLVGITEDTGTGSNTWPDPFGFDLLQPDHPVFTNVPNPYPIGTPFLTSSLEWKLLPTASLLATATPTFDVFTGNGAIIANQTPNYRGLYFSHYIEDEADGANLYDMQTFYNGLLWTSVVPEPATLFLVAAPTALLIRRSRKLKRTPTLSRRTESCLAT